MKRIFILPILIVIIFTTCTDTSTNTEDPPEDNYTPTPSSANCTLTSLSIGRENSGNWELWGIKFRAEIRNSGDVPAKNVLLRICGLSYCTGNPAWDCIQNSLKVTINGNSFKMIEITTPTIWFNAQDGCNGNPNANNLTYSLTWQ